MSSFLPPPSDSTGYTPSQLPIHTTKAHSSWFVPFLVFLVFILLIAIVIVYFFVDDSDSDSTEKGMDSGTINLGGSPLTQRTLESRKTSDSFRAQMSQSLMIDIEYIVQSEDVQYRIQLEGSVDNETFVFLDYDTGYEGAFSITYQGGYNYYRIRNVSLHVYDDGGYGYGDGDEEDDLSLDVVGAIYSLRPYEHILDLMTS